jgi:uncharacterized membrane protein YkgB
MVFVLLFFGAFKFTEMEAKAIEPLVANSPFMSWLYTFLGTQTVAGLVGAVEIAIAVAIASRPLSPAASAIGSIAAAAMFMATFSFLFTTPGVWVRVAGWFPVPVPNEAGGFLAKDLFLIGAALWSAGEALQAIPRIRTWKVGLR